MKHRKIHSCHMGIIFSKKYMIWKSKKCVHTHSQIMCDHTGNVYCDFFSKCPSINLPDQETDDQYPGTIPSISFHIYHLIARCKKHGRLPLTDKKICCMFKHDTASGKSTNIYTRKYLVMMETTISNFY